MKTQPQQETDKKEVISIRIDQFTSERISRVAKRLKSSKSSVMRLGLERVLSEADAGKITLLPVNK